MLMLKVEDGSYDSDDNWNVYTCWVLLLNKSVKV
jgi:hypothetical protein